jgi:ABC-type multidrug transport system ATPase subunit
MTDQPEAMIEIEGLTLTLGERRIFDGADLLLRRGEICALCGDSGVGKTTLLRVLLGLYRPQTGRVAIAGLELQPENLAAIRAETFYLPQEIRALDEETVVDYLALPFSLRINRRRRFDRAEAGALLDRLRLDPALLDQRLEALSGGERRRVGLARGLLLQRKLLLLDEPTASVDAESAGLIVDLVLAERQRTVLAVTHDERFVARSTRCVELAQGRLEPRRPQG